MLVNKYGNGGLAGYYIHGCYSGMIMYYKNRKDECQSNTLMENKPDIPNLLFLW